MRTSNRSRATSTSRRTPAAPWASTRPPGCTAPTTARADGAADVEARVAAFFADYAAALAGRGVRAVLVFDGKGPAAKKASRARRRPGPRQPVRLRGRGPGRGRGGGRGVRPGGGRGRRGAGGARAARRRVLRADGRLRPRRHGRARCLFAAKLATAGDGRPTLVGSEFELRALGASGTFLGWPRERPWRSASRAAATTRRTSRRARARARAGAGAADAEVVLQRLLREPRCPEGFAGAFRAAVRLFTAGD